MTLESGALPPATWENEIESWRTAMRSMRLSPQTVALRRYHLRRLARAGLATSPWDVTAAQLIDWTGTQLWRRETARAVRSSLRRFWAWGITTGRTTTNVAEALPAVQPEQPKPRPATPEVVAQALATADAKVTLMIRLANDLGMRRGEVAQVHPRSDLVRDTSGWSLVVHGKGSRNRILPVPDDLARVLLASPEGFLFPGPTDGHLSAHWVGTLVSRALGGSTTMHQLRHLCATEVHEQTHDIRLVQVLLGHASLATTQRYVAVDDAKIREAIAARSHRWQGT